MQVTGDPECTSELSSSAAREQNVHRAGPSGILTHPPENNDAAVDWLCQRRSDALKAVDEGGFTYVTYIASLSRLSCSPCYAAAFGLNYT
jgi:hypothetical protein